MSPKKEPLNDAERAAMITELSESAFFQTTSTQTGKTTSGQVDKPTKPLVDKYTTHLLPATIKAVKRYAFEHDMKDYEVIQQALDQFLASDEQEPE
jgi:hypothetical protein